MFVDHANQLSQLNQLDRHDTARFLTLLNGDKEKMRLALGLLMTCVGTPCLYYGSEVGLNAKQLHQLLDKGEVVSGERHFSVNIPAMNSKIWQFE